MNEGMSAGSGEVVGHGAYSNPFESLRKLNEFGAEYWSAREIQSHLGYSKWSNFKKAVEKAIASCESSGNQPEYHFASAGKMIGIGKGGQRDTGDFHLSRFACYLIAQNGDPRKVEIATAQKYFAIQTRRQELSDQAAADMERLELRAETKEGFKNLCGAARNAGVQNKMFGVFHDAGYKGMYGMGSDSLKARKGVGPNEELLDRVGITELAANNFRYTQTRDKLARENIRSQEAAIQAHREVGKKVRQAIADIGGTMPEDLPAVEHIKIVEKRIKKSQPKLTLAEEHAKGLIGDGFDNL